MSEKKQVKKQDSGKAAKKSNFFGDLKMELKRVTWPDKNKLMRTTAAVVVISVGFALLIWLVDTLVYGGLNLIGFHEENKLPHRSAPAVTETVPSLPSETAALPTETAGK